MVGLNRIYAQIISARNDVNVFPRKVRERQTRNIPVYDELWTRVIITGVDIAKNHNLLWNFAQKCFGICLAYVDKTNTDHLILQLRRDERPLLHEMTSAPDCASVEMLQNQVSSMSNSMFKSHVPHYTLHFSQFKDQDDLETRPTGICSQLSTVTLMWWIMLVMVNILATLG